MNDRTFLAFLSALPKNALSRWAGAFSRARLPGPLRMGLMRAFVARYRVDLSECAGLEEFETFSQFFARPLRPGLRPVAAGDAVIVAPVDGVVSQAGRTTSGRLVQAKGLSYTAEALLGDATLAARLADGPFATFYLSPRDYHRIHFPLGGSVQGYRYLPGQLWPVNPASVRGVPDLFTVNERLVTVLETSLGLCAVVAVGATVVGRIRATYDPGIPVSNARGGRRLAVDYPVPIPVVKGQELGAFELGSTVIVLCEPERAEFRADLGEGVRVRMGEPIGAAGPGRRGSDGVRGGGESV
ncbi:MAG TPA: archaetidylserine decarboxylase [Anaeromyxobacteraceae bacterium]|nr:archaetidylserine decarboxylase [Anaeromyxobacteraceae bacterium]